MEDHHGKVLLSNHTYLIDEISKSKSTFEKMVSYLRGKGIISVRMHQDFEAMPALHAKVRSLLQLMPRTGPEAFQYFIESLISAGQRDIAEHICPGSTKNIQPSLLLSIQDETTGEPRQNRQDESNEEEEGFTDSEFSEEGEETCLAEAVKPVTKRALIEKYKDETSPFVYSVSSPIRGVALIINNYSFVINGQDMPRKGSEVDSRNMKQLFALFHFKVDFRLNRTAEQMEKDIRGVVQSPEQADYKTFVLVIMSHGIRHSVIGVKGNLLTIDSLYSLVDGKGAPMLAGKPKLLLIQACQGDSRDYGVVATDGECISKQIEGLPETSLLRAKENNAKAAEEESHEAEEESREGGEENFDFEASEKNKVGTPQDIILAQATFDGHVAYRNHIEGSYFIRAVMKVFQKHACHADVGKLLTEVGRKISKAKIEIKKMKVMQTVKISHQLVKEFNLYPGLLN